MTKRFVRQGVSFDVNSKRGFTVKRHLEKCYLNAKNKYKYKRKHGQNTRSAFVQKKEYAFMIFHLQDCGLLLRDLWGDGIRSPELRRPSDALIDKWIEQSKKEEK